MAASGHQSLSFEQLAELREKTEAISQFLQQQLKTQLETLRPLLSPRRLLGKYVRTGVKEEVVGEEKALAQLREKYNDVCGTPFGLPPDLDDSALDLLENRLDLYPWEYSYEAKTGKETKAVTITSPLRWVLSYSSNYSLAQLRQVLSGRAERHPDSIRHFVIHALAMQLLLAKFPGIVQLFHDLRYEVRTETFPGLGNLPLVSISSCVPSFRPSDELIVTATRYSGVPAFIELIDLAAVQSLPDPLKTRIEGMLC